ncbi:sialate O-acetylesterase [Flavobacterium sp. TSSA_36]|uniref:sialate O-acetylesterase n=1 Tax=Flavobacterium sp. TSSA_36 TaxID=3447669 RepID=UPI003F34E9B5
MNKQTSKISLYLLLYISCFTTAYAKVQLPTILSDNMVLQQLSEVKLWGVSQAGKKIKVTTSWNSKKYICHADAKGNWMLKISTPKAGGPFNIVFSDGEVLTLKNILIGEVWFCSGQSNMEMPLQGFPRQLTQGGNDVIAKANPKIPIRIFSTDSKEGKTIKQFAKQPQSNCEGAWVENSSENIANTSATAYFFAQYLQEVLEVPVGIIVSTWGGSMVEAWMSREAIAPFQEINTTILDQESTIQKPNMTPCVLYNAKIAPLIPFAIKGFLWYQGESNCNNAEMYRQLMPAFVQDLRSKWNLGVFPFYFVQIAPFQYDQSNGTKAARLREIQETHSLVIPNSGMVTTLDIGSLNFIHPQNKKIIGERLALWALGNTYGRKGFLYQPPVFKQMEKKEHKIYIDFSNATRGIYPMWTQLKGFEIAGEDQIFYPANATIETQSTRLAVWSEAVTEPKAVRYAYKNYEEASIFGLSGIPVAPFRTDDWPLK